MWLQEKLLGAWLRAQLMKPRYGLRGAEVIEFWSRRGARESGLRPSLVVRDLVGQNVVGELRLRGLVCSGDVTVLVNWGSVIMP
ncbi:hypothetical protein CRG98_047255 [Punica granatum]|uniref:Uncharacterized protein n=1 Tax=Punica granatum TaxID=22663 RepID=A0A2I0HKW4_PUNGR|nr:hypothetical protein CRG98_047255 [Punica granatum]